MPWAKSLSPSAIRGLLKAVSSRRRCMDGVSITMKIIPVRMTTMRVTTLEVSESTEDVTEMILLVSIPLSFSAMASSLKPIFASPRTLSS